MNREINHIEYQNICMNAFFKSSVELTKIISEIDSSYKNKKNKIEAYKDELSRLLKVSYYEEEKEKYLNFRESNKKYSQEYKKSTKTVEEKELQNIEWRDKQGKLHRGTINESPDETIELSDIVGNGVIQGWRVNE